MYWINQTVDTFCKFRLDTIPEYWVVDIWEKLLDIHNFPQEFEEVHLDTLWPELLAEAIAGVRKCAPLPNKSSTSGSSSPSAPEADNATLWTNAMKRGICPKALTAILGFFIEKGVKAGGNFTAASCGLQAAHLYISLLCLPDSNVFQVFNSIIYQRALENLQVVKVIARLDRESGNTSPKAARPRKRRPVGGNLQRRPRKLSIHSDGNPEDDPDEDGTWPEESISPLTEQLLGFVRDVVRLLETYSFRSHVGLLEDTVERLCMLVVESDGSGRKALADTSMTAFDALAASCNQLHGNVSRSVELVMKHLLEVIITGASTSKATRLILHMMAEVGEDAVDGVKTLIQNMCIRVPDKADGRARVAIFVVCLLSQLPRATYAYMIKWLRDRYMWNIKVAYRILVVELFARLLAQKQIESPTDGSVPEDMLQYLKHETLLVTVIGRCSDKAATVRSKALAVFGDCLCSRDPHVVDAVARICFDLPHSKSLHTIVVPPVSVSSVVTETPGGDGSSATVPETVTPLTLEPNIPTPGEQPSASVGSLITSTSAKDDSADANTDTLLPLLCPDPLANPGDVELPSLGQIMSLLKRRAAEEKVNVRKVALQVMETVLKIHRALCTKETLEIFQLRCRDPSVMVRKQMAVSLTSLLQHYPQDELVQQTWLQGVFPLIVDCESTVQEKCLELLDGLLMRNITRCRPTLSTSQSMAWCVFQKLANEENQMFRYFQKALTAWYRQGKLKGNLADDLSTHVDSARNDAAWLLLSFVTLMVNVKDASYAAEYWKTHVKDAEPDYNILSQVLTVLANSAKVVPQKERDDLMADFKATIKNFECPFELVSPMVSAVIKLNGVKSRASTNDYAHAWGSDVIKACNRDLSRMILNEKHRLTDADETAVLRQLHTLSDVCIKCHLQPPKRLILAIESLLATGQPAAVDIKQQGALGPLNDSLGRPRIRAQAFVTLGKLSLQDEVLAKQCVPAFASELESSDDPVIRNNIVIIFTDLCRRYATLVDPHLSAITACLRDPHPIVRRQTLTALARLLREEYIKWKGSLYFRILVTMVDEVADIRALANYCLSDILAVKHPHMFFQHFVECVFHFNCYQKHSTYNKFSQTEKEIKVFSLQGNVNTSKRITLYRYMLQNMNDSHRLQITARLCQDVLGGVVDEAIPFDKDSYGLLQDALKILSCEDIKLASMTAPNQDAVEGGDDEDVVAAAVANVNKNLVTQVVKFNVVENIMPTTIALKQKLEQCRSPLLRDLMAFLKEIMKDFRNEVKEVLAVDKQLAKEIEFDLKRYDQETEKAARANLENQVVQSMLDSFHVAPSMQDVEEPPPSQEILPQPQEPPVLEKTKPKSSPEKVVIEAKSKDRRQQMKATRRTVTAVMPVDPSMTPVVRLERLHPGTCPQLRTLVSPAKRKSQTEIHEGSKEENKAKVKLSFDETQHPVASTSGVTKMRTRSCNK